MNPWHFGADPVPLTKDPDPAPDPTLTSFFSYFKDAKKNIFFSSSFCLITYPDMDHQHWERHKISTFHAYLPLLKVALLFVTDYLYFNDDIWHHLLLIYGQDLRSAVEGLQNGREQSAAARQSKQEVTKILLLINRVGSKKKYTNLPILKAFRRKNPFIRYCIYCSRKVLPVYYNNKKCKLMMFLKIEGKLMVNFLNKD